MSSTFSTLLERAKRVESSIDTKGIPNPKKSFEALSTLSSEFNENVISESLTDITKTNNAQLFLASKGFETEKLATSVDTTNFTNTETPMSQLDPTDINGFLEHHHQLIMHSVLEDAKKESLSQSTINYATYISDMWESQCQNLISGSGWTRTLAKETDNYMLSPPLPQTTDNTLYPHNENILPLYSINMNTLPSKTSPPIFTEQMKQYGEVIKKLCVTISNDLSSTFQLVQQLNLKRDVTEGNSDLDFCWRLLTFFFNESEGALHRNYYSDYKTNQTSNEKLLYKFLAQSLLCLETDYFNFIQKRVHASNPKGTPDEPEEIIYDYTEILLIERNKMSDLSTRVDDVALWQLIFYCLRCGKIDVALSIISHNRNQLKLIDESNKITKALKLLENEPKTLVNEQNLFSELMVYHNALLTQPDSDPYLIGVVSLISHTPIKNKEIVSLLYPTVQDYYFYKLKLICHPLLQFNNQFITEYENLVDTTINRFGSSYFSSGGTKPLIYFEVLLMLCKFEDAIDYLVHQSFFLSVEAVHFAIIFHYYGVLFTNTNNRLNDQTYLIPSQNDRRSSLALLDIINNYIVSINSIDPLLSSLYLYLILIDNKDELNRSFVKFIFDNSTCRMFYDDIDENGRVKAESLLDKLLTPNVVKSIINQAALQFEKNGNYERSIELYILSENWDRILQLLNYQLSQSLRYEKIEAGSVWVNVSRNIESIYFQNSTLFHDKTAFNTFIQLLNLSIYFENYDNGNWIQCVSIMNELNILPKGPSDLEVSVENFKRCDQYIKILIDKILDTFMQVLYKDYEMKRNQTNKIESNTFDSLRERANTITTFMSLSDIYPPTEMNARISQLKVMMEC